MSFVDVGKYPFSNKLICAFRCEDGLGKLAKPIGALGRNVRKRLEQKKDEALTPLKAELETKGLLSY